MSPPLPDGITVNDVMPERHLSITVRRLARNLRRIDLSARENVQLAVDEDQAPVSQYIGENHRVARKLETYLQLSQNVRDALNDSKHHR
jgi:hypothetical protein